MKDRGRPLGVRHAKSAAAHAALDAGTASTNPVTSAGAATSLDGYMHARLCTLWRRLPFALASGYWTLRWRLTYGADMRRMLDTWLPEGRSDQTR